MSVNIKNCYGKVKSKNIHYAIYLKYTKYIIIMYRNMKTEVNNCQITYYIAVPTHLIYILSYNYPLSLYRKMCQTVR